MGRIFLFRLENKFPTGRRAISREIAPAIVEGTESGARGESVMGIGPGFSTSIP
jgi:hypothetical protein